MVLNKGKIQEKIQKKIQDSENNAIPVMVKKEGCVVVSYLEYIVLVLLTSIDQRRHQIRQIRDANLHSNRHPCPQLLICLPVSGNLDIEIC